MEYTAGVVVDPDAGDIIADTGAMGVSFSGLVTFLMWATGTAYITIARRNALNTADVWTQNYFAGPNVWFSIPAALAAGQRLQVRMSYDYVGDIQSTILTP